MFVSYKAIYQIIEVGDDEESRTDEELRIAEELKKRIRRFPDRLFYKNARDFRTYIERRSTDGTIKIRCEVDLTWLGSALNYLMR